MIFRNFKNSLINQATTKEEADSDLLLVIDIGNTTIELAVYGQEKIIGNWRISSQKKRTVDEYGIILNGLFRLNEIDPAQIKQAAISSVVPPLSDLFLNLARKYFKITPLSVGPGIKTGISICCDNPKEVGTDRIVNAVAGYERYGGPLIIVDFGTATTFDAVSEKGEYLGGAISPGIVISLESLFQKTAQLPLVELEKTPRVIGKNTIESIKSGVFYGYLGLVEGMIKRMKQEFKKKPFVLATGGLAKFIAPHCEMIKKIDPCLTLWGLKFILEKNQAWGSSSAGRA